MRVESDRMVCSYDIGNPRRQPEKGAYLLFGQYGDGSDILHAECADIPNPLRSFPHAYDTLLIGFTRSEVKVRHFRHGMTKIFIHSALSCLPSMKVGHRYTLNSGGCHGTEGFIAVSQYHEQIRMHVLQSRTIAGQSQPHTVADASGTIVIQAYIHVVEGSRRIFLYFLYG